MNALARSAFTAHVRSYSTHSPSHNEFLHVKRLHLGHMAKAFALREAPNSVASANSSVIGKKRREVEEEGKKAGWGSFKRKSDMLVGAGANEFSDGGVKKLGKFRPKNSHGSGVNGNLVREGKRFEYSLKKRARN
jgi:ATP-dependent RNA helicase DDX31/DBP7